MKFCKMTVLLVFLTLFVAGPAGSHFGMLIPTDSMVMPDDSRTVTVTLSFSHPFEMVGTACSHMPLRFPAGGVLRR